MKKINYVFIAILGAIVLTSCEKEVEVTKEIQRISFETVELNENGWQNTFPNGLILSDVDFYNYLDPVYFSWSGFAVSNNTDKTTEGWGNQYSVYGNGGADASEKFGIVYDGWYEGAAYEHPFCKLPTGESYKFKGLWVNNATYAALSIKNGDGFAKKFIANDWFKIIITGYNVAGNKTGDVEFYLADFRNGKSFICSDWTFVDLTSLGKINKIGFTFDSTDKSVGVVNTPQYACIDNLVYFFE
ncbi:MAG: DUF4465 domain-containing protein [Paludibacter sp.]|jgi:hypothetical protein|nr:DUF4465 domain-containing protein [Paludibacter sp.]